MKFGKQSLLASRCSNRSRLIEYQIDSEVPKVTSLSKGSQGGKASYRMRSQRLALLLNEVSKARPLDKMRKFWSHGLLV